MPVAAAVAVASDVAVLLAAVAVVLPLVPLSVVVADPPVVAEGDPAAAPLSICCSARMNDCRVLEKGDEPELIWLDCVCESVSVDIWLLKLLAEVPDVADVAEVPLDEPTCQEGQEEDAVTLWTI